MYRCKACGHCGRDRHYVKPHCESCGSKYVTLQSEENQREGELVARLLKEHLAKGGE